MVETMNIRNWAAVVLVSSLLGSTIGILLGQEKKTYELTETQTLRLKVKQLEYVSAFEHYQQAVGAFNAEVKAVEKEHDWPETVQFDPNTLTFREPAPSPKKSDSENPTRPPLMQQTDPVKKP
jgi:hypothetical protein